MNTYTPINGIAQDYIANYELLTHTLRGQPTLYLVGTNKGYTSEVLPLPYFPSTCHGVGVSSYWYNNINITETFYAFEYKLDALAFAQALGHQEAIGVLHDNGTIGIARINQPLRRSLPC